ncbi:MAG TPA: 50S ribosomal protein L11 methyltransferase [Labilithrix sp.]|jgi:protein arginine N-methyltransferase 1
MYSVVSFGWMASDGVRMDAYARAIARVVKPGSVVVDIGAGTGVFSLLALRAGAKRVHAIDPNPAVWLARELAVENGFGDRLEVHDRASFDVDLAERADVVVSDLRGSFPLYDVHLATLADARKRLLAPGGVLLPAQDGLVAALVESERFFTHVQRGWTGLERHGFGAAAARTSTVNTSYTDGETPVDANEVLTTAARWATLRYGEPVPPVFEGTVELAPTRGGVAHAIAIWFEATILEGVGYTNAPGHRTVYSRTLLPLLEPVRVEHGEKVTLTLRADATGARWAWETTFANGRRMRQTTFLGMPTSAEALLRASASFAPVRAPRGDRAACVLAMMDGVHTVEQIAEAIASSAPNLPREALVEEVRSHARRYGR